jgi:hypothetical protein
MPPASARTHEAITFNLSGVTPTACRQAMPRRTADIERLESVLYARETVYMCARYLPRMCAELPRSARRHTATMPCGCRDRTRTVSLGTSLVLPDRQYSRGDGGPVSARK